MEIHVQKFCCDRCNTFYGGLNIIIHRISVGPGREPTLGQRSTFHRHIISGNSDESLP